MSYSKEVETYKAQLLASLETELKQVARTRIAAIHDEHQQIYKAFEVKLNLAITAATHSKPDNVVKIDDYVDPYDIKATS